MAQRENPSLGDDFENLAEDSEEEDEVQVSDEEEDELETQPSQPIKQKRSVENHSRNQQNRNQQNRRKPRPRNSFKVPAARGPRGTFLGKVPFQIYERVYVMEEKSAQHFQPAIISRILGDGYYGVMLDSDRQNEYINIKSNCILKIQHHTYTENQQVHGYFAKAQIWKPATITSTTTERDSDNIYQIQFDGFNRDFETSSEYIRPIYEPQTPIFGWFGKYKKWLPGTIINLETESQFGSYTVSFKKFGEKEFTRQRPNHIVTAESFTDGEEIWALWGATKKYHRAVVRSVISSWRVEVAFNGLTKKTFEMITDQIYKDNILP